MDIRREESERQLELIAKLVERTESRTRKGPSEKDVQLVRLAEKDDIETYLGLPDYFPEGDGSLRN